MSKSLIHFASCQFLTKYVRTCTACSKLKNYKQYPDPRLGKLQVVFDYKKISFMLFRTTLKCNVALYKNKTTFLICFPIIQLLFPLLSRPTYLNNHHIPLKQLKTTGFSSLAYNNSFQIHLSCKYIA